MSTYRSAQKIGATSLDEHIEHVARRIRELRELQRQLKALREQCDGMAKECGILDGLKRVDLQKPDDRLGIHTVGRRRPPRGTRRAGHSTK